MDDHFCGWCESSLRHSLAYPELTVTRELTPEGADMFGLNMIIAYNRFKHRPVALHGVGGDSYERLTRRPAHVFYRPGR